ncbi:uroporphyrinogen-III synthase [Nitrospira sp. Kam-Ns4a]
MAERPGFADLRVAAFESRMAVEMAGLIRRHGGEPFVAPALREVPLEDNVEALRFGEQLLAGQCDLLILLTGVGARALVALLETRHPPEAVWAALARTTLVARGPKPVAALREWGLAPAVTVPEPNTWRDLLRALDAHGSLVGRRVAVQEYGMTNPELLAGLVARGALVTRVPVYRWALPEDTGPLRQLLAQILDGRMDVLLVTNAAQVEQVMRLLEQEGRAEAFQAALRRMVVGSIGAIASEALRSHGLPVDLEPSHPRMGVLVKEAAERAHEQLRRKRAVP